MRDREQRGWGTEIAHRPVAAQALLESTQDGLYVVDGQGRVQLINPEGARLLGWSAEELIGRPAHETFHFQHADGTPHLLEDCPLVEVLRTGRAARDSSDAFTRADGQVFEVAYRSSPLIEGGEVTGALVVFRDISVQRGAERSARKLAQERLWASQEWQRNLLPATLPQIAGVDLAVAFRPVGDEAVVGGDFFDVIAAPQGHLVVVGDVQGKGAGAAAIAGMARYVLRGAGQASSQLPQLIDLVNRELLAHPSTRFLTLVLAHLTPLEDGRMRATIACAGHPRAVLIDADGGAREIGGGGTLLGVHDEPAVECESVDLDVGDALVLFSDGLLDVGRRMGRGEFDALSALHGTVPASSAEVITRLEQAAQVPDTDAPDDICVLAMRVTPHDASAVPSAPRGAVPSEDIAVGIVEVGFREHNERLVAGRPDTEGTLSVICECGRPDCLALLDVTHELYQRVRDDDRSFVVVPGHELLHVEEVTERHTDVVVVRKTDGAGEAAEALAPGRD